MNDNKNAVISETDLEDDSFDFDELEEQLEAGLKDSLSELEFLEADKAKISDPENLGNAIMGVVWDQFINQIGIVAGEDFIAENRGLTLDLRKEAHIQTTENFANGKIAIHNTEIDYQQRFDDWQGNFQRNEDGSIRTRKDTRTGEDKAVLRVKNTKKDPNGENYNTNYNARAPFDKNRPKGSVQENMDEIISVAEIIRDPAANAHLTKEEQIAFDNSEKNLYLLDARANESKGDSTMSEWLESERNGEKPADRFNIDEDELREKDKEAREEYEKLKKKGEERSIAAGKKSRRNEAFRIGGKALRAAVMGLLAELIRNIISKLIAWFKSKDKNLKTFIGQIKGAIRTFISNIKQNLLTAGITIASTVLSAILGPVVGTIQKIWMLLKQGGKSVKEAINYIKKPENRKKSFGVLMLEVGKIVMTGLTASGALVLGDVIEKALLAFPVFAIEIPLIGSLANIIGIFLGAVVAGIAGALVLNLIDKLIAKKLKQKITGRRIDVGNKVLNLQGQLYVENQKKLDETKDKVGKSIKDRHKGAAESMRESTDYIFTESKNDNSERLADINAKLKHI